MNLLLLWLKWIFADQSYHVTIPSLLLSKILNNSRACCSVISNDISWHAFQTSLWVNTWFFLPAKVQNALNASLVLYLLSLIHYFKHLRAMLNYFDVELLALKKPDWLKRKLWLSLRDLLVRSNILEATERSKPVIDLFILLSSMWILKVDDKYCLVLGSISKNYWLLLPSR